MRIINIIEPKVPQMPTRKKVAAYARVSMESERLQHSLSAQVSYYSDLIQKHPGWEYVGVYAEMIMQSLIQRTGIIKKYPVAV